MKEQGLFFILGSFSSLVEPMEMSVCDRKKHGSPLRVPGREPEVQAPDGHARGLRDGFGPQKTGDVFPLPPSWGPST